MADMLKDKLPEAVEVAILEDLQWLLAAEDDFSMRGLAGLEAASQYALFGYDVNPLDEMGIFHGVIDASDVDDDLVAIDHGDGNVLFLGGVGRVRFDDLHGLTAARQRAATVNGLHDNVAAHLATVKRGPFHGNRLS